MITNLIPGGPFRLNPMPLPPPNSYSTTNGEIIPLIGHSNPQQSNLCNAENFTYTIVNTPSGFGVIITAAPHVHISGTVSQGETVDPISGNTPVIQVNVSLVAPGMGGNAVTLNFPIHTTQLAFVPWDATQGYGPNVETRVLNGEGFSCNLLT